PGLEGPVADGVLALVAVRGLPGWAAAAVLAAGVAALMSTMDSQLLVMSAMVVRDLPRVFKRERFRFPGRRTSIILLAAVGLALAIRPAGTMLAIATQAFTGLAVLFPVTIAAAYWRGANPWAGLASIITGQALVALYHFKLLPSYGFLPVVPVVLASAAVLIAGSLLFPARELEPWAGPPTRTGMLRALAFALIFLAALDFWAWPQAGTGLLGLPVWLPYHLELCLLLSLVIARLCRAPQQEQNLRSRSVSTPSRPR
ncbi:MAG TPA: hypothetical protein ENN51_01065, partial [candidate division WOR-3 bacterium]|nr:hypothetical protein [candidate division WOR-3 bacterium]